MGVKGLWKLIECTGVPVPLETLEHKILAVDVSIWLHQAVRGFRGPGGASVANAHLLTLFHRICKLLFYRIRPVFVFDGGVPYLKKQTLASRKLRRDVAASKAKQVRERLLKNILKSQAVRRALGRAGPGPSLAHVPRPQKKEKDMFELPPLPEPENDDGNTTVKSEDSEDEDQYILRNLKLPNLHHFDFESNDFKALNIETQHEILSELQDTRKQNSWGTINEMPKESETFAEFQMGRLIKRRNFQDTLDSTREEIRKIKTTKMEEEMLGELEKHVSLSQQIISEDDAHSIFVKKVKDSEEEKLQNDENLMKEDKGKSLLKRKQKTFGKDFLTELAKQGIVRPHSHSDSDSDSDDLCYHPGNLDEDSLGENEKDKQESIEEEGFLHVVGALMENSGLTQEEILALIKQDNSNQSQSNESRNVDGPSTSEKAPGFVFNPDADSSDDDGDFIEVMESPSQQYSKNENQKQGILELKEGNNVDELLATKSDSLLMKIIHQKVDDMVHTNAFKPSPQKASFDTRQFNCQEIKNQTHNGTGGERLKSVKISLDFDVKPLKMEDDIFADIFTDIINQPFSQPGLKPQKNADSEHTMMDVSSQNSVHCITKCGSNDVKARCNYELYSKAENLSKCEKASERLLVSKSEDTSLFAAANKESTSLQHNLKEDPKRIPVSSSNQASNNSPSDIKVDDALQIKINELVKLQIDKMVNTTTQEENRELNMDHKPGEEQDDDFEFMSSSDDTLMAKSQQPKPVGNPGSNMTCSIPPPPNTKRMQCTSDSDSDSDFVEVEEVCTNEVSNEINCEMKHADNDKEEKNTNLEPKMEQQSRDSNTFSVVETEKNFREVAVDRGEVKEQPVIVNSHKTNNEQERKDYNSRTKNGEALNSVQDETNVETVEEVDRPLNYCEDELKLLEGELAAEQQTLVAQAQKTDRIASNLNEQIYGESQHLLQLFGIPYLVAPMEAEAQCAFLNAVNLSNGTITDDSDIFLFGGSKVYRNFFNQNRHVEFFNADNIQANIGLNRQKMITLALLTGSDYTEGIESVGAVTAMEVLAEFPGEGIECLRSLKKWWNAAHKNVVAMYTSKVKQKMSHVMLMESFPNEKVYEAYLNPDVDESREKFTWAVPNVEALRTFTMEKFGWNSAKADEILIPVMKKLGIKTSQMRIDSYFTNIKLVKESKVTSKRMQDAIAKAKGEMPPNHGSALVKDRTKKSNIRVKSAKKKRKMEDSDKVTENETSETVDDPDIIQTPTSKPSRTLLIDPSESSSCVSEPPKPKRKRKKKLEESEIKGPQQSLTVRDNDEDYQPPRKLTKEDMYKALLEKQTISQRESDLRKMEERKAAAAQLLKKQRELGKAQKR